MKATERYFPVVLVIMLYKVVLNFESVDEILIKATELYFPKVLLTDYAVQSGSSFWLRISVDINQLKR